MSETDTLATITFEALAEPEAAALARRTLGTLVDAPQLSGAIETVLAPIVKAAPDAAHAIAQRGRYLVEFSAEGQAALQDGAVRFLQRTDGRLQPTLVSQASRFEENAVLVGRAGQRVAAAAAVAHVVVLLAVQAQLVSMERSLERIEKKLDALRRRLDQEKVAQVRGRLRALQKLRDELATSEWSSEDRLRWQVALDQADTEFHQVEELARLQCDDAARETRTASMNVAWFGPSGYALAEQLRDHVDRFRRHEELLLLCLLGRLVVAHLRNGLGAPTATDDLRRDVDRALAASNSQEELVLDRALDFTTKFRRATFEVGTRKALRNEAHAAREQSDKTIATLHEQLATLSAREPLRVRALVEVADGSVREVRVLE